MLIRIKKTLSDYRNAIATARSGGLNLWAASHSVTLARLSYQLGPRFHSIFELWKKPRSSWPEYTGSYEVNERHRPLSSIGDQQLTSDKIAFSVHCTSHELPTVPILCVLDHKPEETHFNPKNCLNLTDWLDFAGTAPTRIFIKPIDGLHGTGAFAATRHDDTWSYAGKVGSASDLHEYCLRNIQGKRGWLIQPEIKPHPELAARMSPRALATVRAITRMTDAGSRMMFAVLRIPAGSNSTDNWAYGLTGNLVAPIDLDTGIVGVGRTSSSPTWPVMYATNTHPDTGQNIDGYRLPYWEEVKELVLKGQESLPKIPTLGWDIAITEAGPLIVETNWAYGVETIQVALQRGIRSDLSPTFALPKAN